ncbi:hypothetical protein GCM10027030_18870 [Luteococcus sediminum]
MAGVQATTEPNELWRLTYTGGASTGQWLSEINSRFELRTALLYATVHEIDEQVLGVLVVQAIGDEAQRAAARRLLEDAGVDVAHQPLAELTAAPELNDGRPL